MFLCGISKRKRKKRKRKKDFFFHRQIRGLELIRKKTDSDPNQADEKYFSGIGSGLQNHIFKI